MREHLDQLIESVHAGDLDTVRDHLEATEALRGWLALDRFDRHAVSRLLRLYAVEDDRWRQEL